MQGCSNNEQLIGRAKTLELAYGCSDQMPAEGDWKLMGLPTSATWDMSPEALTSDADNGGFSSNLIASLDPTYSIEGEVRVQDRTDEFGIQQFVKYIADEVRARRQPAVWMRFHWGDFYHIGYMVPTGASDGGGVKEIVTYSFEFKLADGNTFQITEADDGIPVTGVTVAPTTSTVAAGSSTTFTVNVAPDDADNKLFTVTSSVPSRATLAFTGNTVTVSAPSGATAGTAVITVKTVDGEFIATHTVTVTV
ncbi:TPA: Ig domain-containing protein [Klebsiella oxytoca]|uniref:Ig-like domain-containing protein n=1 Tax=Klebsiella oxytoca TaxID=571 RepID=UPI001B961C19|nr:Ig-like domain-containing protein [Klebsiella oxytoca]MCW9662136.1 Ig-like domain-containing protein [Klebsiella oxytoca]HBC7877563.1 Ig domain-containing protein [Klebsiella oxytoca]HCL7585003.1 Ig domain-containing protein [Klebsiella oxytoca]HCQ8454657.1 Ig domain-containing protein [Klebsiella oxytoca]HCZ8658844.1 Ig domain-containing protein [Klebsiella oxytoca]